jgi:hypothetical protein
MRSRASCLVGVGLGFNHNLISLRDVAVENRGIMAFQGLSFDVNFYVSDRRLFNWLALITQHSAGTVT